MSAEKITDRDLLHDAVFDYAEGYSVVETQERGKGRWSEHMTTILRRESDGKLFMADWQRGLTENQDHEYPEEAVECTAQSKTITITTYVPVAGPPSIATAKVPKATTPMPKRGTPHS